MFKLTLRTDNAACDMHDMPGEIARILRAAADAVEQTRWSGPLIDCNGNTVGRYELTTAPGP